jgi:hypothetical protein
MVYRIAFPDLWVGSAASAMPVHRQAVLTPSRGPERRPEAGLQAPKTLKGLTPYEYICKIWTAEPERFRLNPIHQMPGLYT